VWVNTASFERICAGRKEQASVLGAASVITLPGRPVEQIRYVPCPECSKLMHRVNFANCSGVIVDVCKAHGTWFDKGEMTHIIEFIQSGGLELSKAKRQAELEAAERRLKHLQQMRAAGERSPSPIGDSSSHSGLFDAVQASGGLLDFFRSDHL
jgi:Zn-finger nucleic acid-binding protein